MVSKPIVGVITSETSAFGGRQLLHSAGQRYVDTLMKFSNVIPTLIPTCLIAEILSIMFRQLMDYY